MLECDLSPVESSPDIAKEVLTSPPAAVEKADLNDRSSTAGWQLESLSLKQIEEKIGEFLNYERDKANLSQAIESHMNGQTLTESALRHVLLKAAKLIRDPKIRAHYTHTHISTAQLCELLGYLDSRERSEIVQAVILNLASDPAPTLALKDKIDNVLAQTSISERGQLIKLLLALPECRADRERCLNLVSSALRASETLTALDQTIKHVGVSSLLKLQDSRIDEYLAHAELDPLMRQVVSKFDLNDLCDASEAVALFKGLQDDIIRICEQHPRFHQTQIARDFVDTARDNLEKLDADILELDGSNDKILEAVRLYSKAAQLEFHYGVKITHAEPTVVLMLEIFGEQVTLRPDTPHWTDKDLEDIRAVLQTIPEGEILFTPLLKEIVRVDMLGWNILGARFRDGTVKIASLAINHSGIEQEYEGLSSLKIVLAHEFGHAMQMGADPVDITLDEEGIHFGEGVPEFDFDEWLELSGWELIPKGSFTVNANFSKVTIDGVEYSLDEPVECAGERRVLKFDPYSENLISYRADAKFSHRDYAKASPYEDFAEAMAEYLFLPMRLLMEAPKKFSHLEGELHVYRHDKQIQEMLRLNAELDSATVITRAF